MPFASRAIRGCIAVGLFAFASVANAQAKSPPVSFARQVKPLLEKHCQGCHQPVSQGGKLMLTSYAAFRSGGSSGPPFKPGDPEHSLVMKLISGSPPAMPKAGAPLTATEVELFRRWISEGAKDDTQAEKDPIDAQHPPKYTAPPVISALAYSPDGKTLAVSGYREILLQHADGSGLIARLVGRSPRIESLAYSPDGRMLAAVGGAPARFGEVQFWDTATNRQIGSFELTYDELYGCSFSPDGKQLATGAADSSVRVISVPDGKLLMKFDNHSDWVFATAWILPDVKAIAEEVARIPGAVTNRPLVPEETLHVISTGRDRAVKIIVAKTGSFVDDINTFTSPYRAMRIRPGMGQVLVAGDDGIPRLYQVFRTKARTMNQEDQSLVRAYDAMPGQVNAAAFAPDGKRFAVCGEGGELRLYDTESGKAAVDVKGIPGTLYAIAASPDGQRIAVGGFDGRVRLYDAATGAPVKDFIAVPISPASKGAYGQPIEVRR